MTTQARRRRQPEYWEIEVVGTLPGVGLPVEAPYEVSLPVTGTLGTIGVEVVGANRRERIDVFDTSGPISAEWSAFLDRQPPGPATLRVTGTLQLPTPGYTVQLSRTSPQGINPRDLLLDLTVEPPKDPVIQVVTEVVVTYEEEAPQGFDSVTILPGGPSIPVQEVS